MYKYYYHMLGISKNASENDVKKAYSKMALKDHPNKNKSPDTEEKFKEVSKAHVSSTLSITHQRIKRPMCEQKTKKHIYVFIYIYIYVSYIYYPYIIDMPYIFSFS